MYEAPAKTGRISKHDSLRHSILNRYNQAPLYLCAQFTTQVVKGIDGGIQ
jgi:hypothetical protein